MAESPEQDALMQLTLAGSAGAEQARGSCNAWVIPLPELAPINQLPSGSTRLSAGRA